MTELQIGEHMTTRRPSRRDLLRTAGALAVVKSVSASGTGVSRAEETKGPRGPSLPKIDAALRAATDAKQVPGVVAMAVTDQGIIYEGAFGMRRLGKGPAMTLDTVFRIASMIKPVTSVAAMQLVEQGKLKLDDPVPNLDPALGDPQVLEGFDGSGAPQLRRARRPITLRHLLTHTSGFSYALWDVNTARYLKTHGSAAPPRTPLMFDPGTRWEYGVGLDWVGRLVEAISGQTLRAYFREYILGPLGMKDTDFAPSEQQHMRQASLHARKPDDSLEPQPLKRAVARKSYSGGANLCSTAPDYLTFIRMLLHEGSLNGVRILRPETVALMGQNQIGDTEARILKTTVPALSNDVDFFPGINLRWGFGHMINMQPGPDGRSAGSLTWAGLLNTYYWIDPSKRVAGVIMTQILPFADKFALRLYRQFERDIYNAVKR